MALLSIYDSELQVERKANGGVSLHMKIAPAPPAYIKASVTLNIPAAVRFCCARSHHPMLTSSQDQCSQTLCAQCDTFSPRPIASGLLMLAYVLLQVAAAS